VAQKCADNVAANLWLDYMWLDFWLIKAIKLRSVLEDSITEVD
jgi:hypothetical protein